MPELMSKRHLRPSKLTPNLPLTPSSLLIFLPLTSNLVSNALLPPHKITRQPNWPTKLSSQRQLSLHRPDNHRTPNTIRPIRRIISINSRWALQPFSSLVDFHLTLMCNQPTLRGTSIRHRIYMG